MSRYSVSVWVLLLGLTGCGGSTNPPPEKSTTVNPPPPLTLPTPPDPAELKASELAKLQGTWTMIGTTALGVTVGEEELTKSPSLPLIINGENYTTRTTGTFTIDPTQSPKWYDYTPGDGSVSAGVHRGIYELDGDILKICSVTPSQTERPQDFAPTADSFAILMIYRRAKEEPANDQPANDEPAKETDDGQ